MTREEIIERLRMMKAAWMMTADTTPESQETAEWAAEAINGAISALKGPTRERLENVWRGEWTGIPNMGVYDIACSKCGYSTGIRFWSSDFCPNCGSPMTDKAVDMVMERLEALHEVAE